MVVLGLVRENATWLHAVAVMMGVVSVGRLVGIVADGSGQVAIQARVLELVIAGVMVAAGRFVKG